MTFSHCAMFSQDHPRVCGEKDFQIEPEALVEGSPPRVRGKEIDVGADEAGVGITPACAGKSYIRVMNRVEDKDHPRVCGEKVGVAEAVDDGEGSPPRVRGKENGAFRRGSAGRITPACAGKSS